MSGHTPGPLRADGIEIVNDCRHAVIRDGGERWVALVEIEDAEGEANARLIAAAPDLLEACERVLLSLEWSKTFERMTDMERAEVLRDVIARARGDQ